MLLVLKILQMMYQEVKLLKIELNICLLKKKLLIPKGCISSGPHFNPENKTHGNFLKLKLGL